MSIKTNDIKKGDRIQLRNGWLGTMMDNQKGMIRLAKVEGLFTETGSIYATDIARVYRDGQWHPVELTPKQVNNVRMRRALGF